MHFAAWLVRSDRRGLTACRALPRQLRSSSVPGSIAACSSMELMVKASVEMVLRRHSVRKHRQ
jgi:hypothetical protein